MNKFKEYGLRALYILIAGGFLTVMVLWSSDNNMTKTLLADF